MCARQYARRWLIEDFHKALKTGLGVEKLQLQTAARLFAAVALLSVVALALVDLREKSRLEPDAPAELAGLTPTELRVLRHQSRCPLDTVRAVYLALAALGGHLAGTWGAQATAHPAGKPSGSAAAACACSSKAPRWRRNCLTNNLQKSADLPAGAFRVLGKDKANS